MRLKTERAENMNIANTGELATAPVTAQVPDGVEQSRVALWARPFLSEIVISRLILTLSMAV